MKNKIKIGKLDLPKSKSFVHQGTISRNRNRVHRGRKYLQSKYLVRVLYPDYIKTSDNPITKKPIRKWAKDVIDTSPKRMYKGPGGT